MKSLLILIFLFVSTLTGIAQLTTSKQCPPVSIYILKGTINNVGPNFTPGQIKLALPCFTSEVTEPDSSKCGGLISYADEDMFFYTGRDYIELREKFKGKMEFPLMGAARSSLFGWLGYPKIKDTKWEAFQTAYGILVLHFNADNKVNLIQFSTKGAESLKLCE